MSDAIALHVPITQMETRERDAPRGLEYGGRQDDVGICAKVTSENRERILGEQ